MSEIGKNSRVELTASVDEWALAHFPDPKIQR